jgi:hypothetical protein
MLPGNTVVCKVGTPPPVTYGNDGFTTSLLHFKQPSGWNLATSGNFITDDGAAAAGDSWGALGNVMIQGGPVRPSWFHRACTFDQRVTGNNYLGRQGTGAAQARVWPAGDFTIDLWVYPFVSQVGAVLSKIESNSFGAYLIQQNSGTWQFFASSNGTSWDIAAGQSMGTATITAWHHLAVQKKGSTWTTYLDGAQQATWTNASQPYRNDSTGLILGNNNNLNSPWSGSLVEFRFSQTARYSGAFAPPREPYWGVLNGGNDEATTLLLHFEGANASTTINDDARGRLGGVRIPQPAGIAAAQITTGNFKFGASCFQPTANTGRAAYWNCTDFDFYAQNWTIDFWYFRFTTGLAGLVTKRNTTTSYSPFVLFDNSGVLTLYMSLDGSTWAVNNLTCGTIPLNAWTHIALVMRNQTIYVYMNGVLQNSAALSGGLWVNNDLFDIGGNSDSTGVTPGLFDEFRISDTARWQANFTPPSAPYGPTLGAPPSWPNETLFGYATSLLHLDTGAGSATITDSAINNPKPWSTGGGATLTGAISKFGASCFQGNGGSWWLNGGNVADWDFGNGNFTLDWWEYRVASGGGYPAMSRAWGVTFSPWIAGWDGGSGTALFYATSNGSSWDIASAASMGPIALNAWHHRAVQRMGNNFTTYYDGVQQAAWTASGTIQAAGGTLAVGAGQTNYFNGYIDEVRISKGQAQYVGNFTPATGPYGG